ncbi:MAG: hypothetical protein IPJ32_08220 [Sphingobacteriaceae bacterium]|nr:hypothetical protein [Sphingobacteriaceae bacterium]
MLLLPNQNDKEEKCRFFFNDSFRTVSKELKLIVILFGNQDAVSYPNLDHFIAGDFLTTVIS